MQLYTVWKLMVDFWTVWHRLKSYVTSWLSERGFCQAEIRRSTWSNVAYCQYTHEISKAEIDRDSMNYTNTGATAVLARVKCANQPALGLHVVLITYILHGSIMTTNTLVCVVNRHSAWSVDGLTTVLMCSYVQSRRLSVTGMVEPGLDDPGCSGSDQNGACSPVPDVKVSGRSRRKHGRLIRRH